MEHDCESIIKMCYAVYISQSYFTERRALVDASDYQIAVGVNLQVVVVRCMLEEQRYIERVDAVGTTAVFAVKFVDDFFCDHEACRVMRSVSVKSDRERLRELCRMR